MIIGIIKQLSVIKKLSAAETINEGKNSCNKDDDINGYAAANEDNDDDKSQKDNDENNGSKKNNNNFGFIKFQIPGMSGQKTIETQQDIINTQEKMLTNNNEKLGKIKQQKKKYRYNIKALEEKNKKLGKELARQKEYIEQLKKYIEQLNGLNSNIEQDPKFEDFKKFSHKRQPDDKQLLGRKKIQTSSSQPKKLASFE